VTRQVSLSVNDAPISLDYFVQAFIDHTVSGMIESLEGTAPVKTATLAIDGERVSVTLNGAPVPINAFVSKILRSTTAGMVSPLKGVRTVEKLRIEVSR